MNSRTSFHQPAVAPGFSRRVHPASSIKAFTLIELMVALFLSVFLIGGIILMHTSGRAATIESEQFSRMQENIRFSTDLMLRDIRNARYRDRATLTTAEAKLIDEQYATFGNNGSLEVRYAGHGSCSEAFSFDRPGIVINRYFVKDGHLMCRGNSEGEIDVFGGDVTLIGGVESVQFTRICPDASDTTCECNTGGLFDKTGDSSQLESACIGALITLEFADPNTGASRTVELSAAFRNVLLGRVLFVDDESESGSGGS